MTLRGLVRYVVFFVVRLKTRAVEIAGITSEPDGIWMTQLARNLTDRGTASCAARSTSSRIEARSTLEPLAVRFVTAA